jgi:hypothetical protein
VFVGGTDFTGDVSFSPARMESYRDGSLRMAWTR